MYAKEAKEKLPNLHLVHVDTISPDNITHEYDVDTNKLPDKQKEKVSLKRYRDESKKIMEIFQNVVKTTEKASIDEAFLDVTEEAELLLTIAEEEPNFFDENCWTVFSIFKHN